MIDAVEKNKSGIKIGDINEDKMECFVCNGTGILSRKDVLKKLGGREIIDLLEMSEEQFFEKLEKNSPSLIKQVKETLEEKYKESLAEQVEIKEKEHDLKLDEAKNREQKLMEAVAKLKVDLENEKKAKEVLETKNKSVPSLKGVEGEKDFEDWIGQYAQFECSEKLEKTGDFIVKVKKTLVNGNLEVIDGGDVLVDCKRDKKIKGDDIEKLFRDAKIRGMNFTYLLVESKEQFRGEDHKRRIIEENGIWLFKGDRNNFLDDMSFLEYFIQTNTSDDDTNYKEQKEKLHKLILAKIKELDEFKDISANIIRETRKIDETVDQKKREALEEVKKVVSE